MPPLPAPTIEPIDNTQGFQPPKPPKQKTTKKSNTLDPSVNIPKFQLLDNEARAFVAKEDYGSALSKFQLALGLELPKGMTV